VKSFIKKMEKYFKQERELVERGTKKWSLRLRTMK
jgi:hypothetical protein